MSIKMNPPIRVSAQVGNAGGSAFITTVQHTQARFNSKGMIEGMIRELVNEVFRSGDAVLKIMMGTETAKDFLSTFYPQHGAVLPGLHTFDIMTSFGPLPVEVYPGYGFSLETSRFSTSPAHSDTSKEDLKKVLSKYAETLGINVKI